MRVTRAVILKAADRSSALHPRDGAVQFVQRQLEPQLARLMDDDEQQLVMAGRPRVLGVEKAIEGEIVGIAHLAFEVGVSPAAHRLSCGRRRR